MPGKETTSAVLGFRFSVGSAQQIGWLNSIVKAVLVLNLLDSVLTLIWVNTGIAEEANIFLRDLVNNSPVTFMFVKISLVSLGSLLLWRFRRHPFAVAGLFLVFIAYSAIFVYHLHFLSLLVG